GVHEEAAAVDGEVARESVDPGAELEPALPVAEALRAAAPGLRRRLRLDAGDGGLVAAPPHGLGPRRGRIPMVRPAEAIRLARLGLRHPALRVDQTALDERRRDQLLAVRGRARPAAVPQPGDARRHAAR